MFLYGGSKPPPYHAPPSIANRQNEKYTLHPVSVDTEKYDKTKLTSRKTSEFHYISLARKGADYLP